MQKAGWRHTARALSEWRVKLRQHARIRVESGLNMLQLAIGFVFGLPFAVVFKLPRP